MNALLTQTTVQLREIQQDLFTYENAQDHQAESTCANYITGKFHQILEACDRLDILVNKEQAQRRGELKQRVNEIKYDIKHYQASFDAITQRKQQRDEAERQRDLLLRRKFTSNNVDANGATHINLDHSLQFSQQLDSAHTHVDRTLEQANQAYTNLRNQGLNLKNIHKKMISLGNTLGLSSTVINSIERRLKSDWWLLFGGMIVTLIIMFVLYKWLV